MTERKETPQQRFERKNLKYYSFKFHKTHDQDIINWLDQQINRQGSIKELIRNQILKQQ